MIINSKSTKHQLVHLLSAPDQPIGSNIARVDSGKAPPGLHPSGQPTGCEAAINYLSVLSLDCWLLETQEAAAAAEKGWWCQGAESSPHWLHLGAGC